MKTKIKRDGNTIIVQIDGKLNHENQLPLREDLHKILRPTHTDEIPKQIIFNLERLEFVGSCGISNFIQTLRDFNQRAPVKPLYQNVRSEFRKVIQAFDELDHEPFNFEEPVLNRYKKPMDC